MGYRMLDHHLQLVQGSITQARNLRSLDELASALFERFFSRHPEANHFFEGFDLRQVGPLKFCKISDAFVDVLKYPGYSESSISEELWRHQVHRVQDKEYYFALAESFVETVRATLGEAWSDSHEECWNETLMGLKHNVNLAAEEHLSQTAGRPCSALA